MKYGSHKSCGYFGYVRVCLHYISQGFFFPVKRVRFFFLNILLSYIFYQKFVGRLILIFPLYELNSFDCVQSGVRNAAVLKS